MKIKYFIFSGCSFSEVNPVYINRCTSLKNVSVHEEVSWPWHLAEYIRSLDEDITLDFRGRSHQGQELIQRKCSHAIQKAFSLGFKPEEIAVIPMWSGNDRKSWYITNKKIMQQIIDGWHDLNKHQTVDMQFGNLDNDPDKCIVAETASGGTVRYSPQGGWYHTCWSMDAPEFFKTYLMLSDAQSDDPVPHSVHNSLEQIMMLQNTCQNYGIKICHLFYMDQVFEDFEKLKDHEIINYLIKQFDSKQALYPSMYNYLRQFNDETLFCTDDFHPSRKGHQLYTDNILIPFLQEKGFFD